MKVVTGESMRDGRLGTLLAQEVAVHCSATNFTLAAVLVDIDLHGYSTTALPPHPSRTNTWKLGGA